MNEAGMVYINGWRPFVDPKRISRGKYTGQYWITLTRGRGNDGTIRKGKRRRVPAKAIRMLDKQPTRQLEIIRG